MLKRVSLAALTRNEQTSFVNEDGTAVKAEYRVNKRERPSIRTITTHKGR